MASLPLLIGTETPVEGHPGARRLHRQRRLRRFTEFGPCGQSKQNAQVEQSSQRVCMEHFAIALRSNEEIQGYGCHPSGCWPGNAFAALHAADTQAALARS